MKNLVLRQFDPSIAFRSGECVAEADVRKTVHERSELNGDAAGGNLLVQRAGGNAGRDPSGDHDRVEAQLLDAVTSQHG